MISDRDLKEAVVELLERDVVAPAEDFQDPRQEWRRLFSEPYGTFLLVLVAAGGGMMGQVFPTRSVGPPRLSLPG